MIYTTNMVDTIVILLTGFVRKSTNS